MITALDLTVVFAWVAITLGAGIFAGLRASTDAYWVNRRSTGTLRLLFTIVSTQVGAGAILGVASATFSSGIGFGLVALVSTVTGFAALSYIAPALKRFGDHHRAITLAEIFRVRYGRPVQVAASLVILFTYICILAVQFLGASYLVTMGTGWAVKSTIVLAALSGIVYSAFAGIKGDIVTDTLHFWAKAVVFLLFLFPMLMLRHPPAEWSGAVPAAIWSPLTFGGYPFLVVGLLLGFIIPLLSPELWIKIYAGRTAPEARWVMLLAGLLVIPFYSFAIFTGVLGYALYNGRIQSDMVVIRLVTDTLPAGLLGLGLAAIYSDVISTANTITVVIAGTIFRDLLRMDPTLVSNLRASRMITAAVGIAGALMAIASADLVQLMLNAYYMVIVVGPALAGVALWPRATAKGAVAAIVLGALTTVAFLFITPKEAFLPGLLVCALSFVAVSLATEHSPGEITDRSIIFPR
jgi:solute:Na+ symporter, SSS family